MDYRYEAVAEYMAKVGYETMHDGKYEDLPEFSIERKMWYKIALNMLSELWRVYKIQNYMDSHQV